MARGSNGDRDKAMIPFGSDEEAELNGSIRAMRSEVEIRESMGDAKKFKSFSDYIIFENRRQVFSQVYP